MHILTLLENGLGKSNNVLKFFVKSEISPSKNFKLCT